MSLPDVTQTDFRLPRETVLGRAKQAQWYPIESEKSCVDGRGKDAIIGVPGGDAGLLAAALATIEKLAKRFFSKDEVSSILDRYKETVGVGRFYFHTDDHSHDPTEGEEVDEHHIGCGHLKLAVKNPERYGMRADLVKSLLEVAYSKAKAEASLPAEKRTLDKIILEGGHKEEGVIIVENLDNGQAPAIVPNFEGKQMFVFHSAVVIEMAKRIKENLSRIFPDIDINPDEFEQEFVRMFLDQTAKTVETLAVNKETKEPLPTYRIVIHQDESGDNEVKIL